MKKTFVKIQLFDTNGLKEGLVYFSINVALKDIKIEDIYWDQNQMGKANGRVISLEETGS